MIGALIDLIIIIKLHEFMIIIFFKLFLRIMAFIHHTFIIVILIFR